MSEKFDVIVDPILGRPRAEYPGQKEIVGGGGGTTTSPGGGGPTTADQVSFDDAVFIIQTASAITGNDVQELLDNFIVFLVAYLATLGQPGQLDRADTTTKAAYDVATAGTDKWRWGLMEGDDDMVLRHVSGADVLVINDSDEEVNINAQVDINSHKIINLTDPSNNQDAATKAYVDATAINGYTQQDYEKTSTYVYVGYTESGGAWFIYRRTISSNTREYATGASGYAAAWTARAAQTYS